MAKIASCYEVRNVWKTGCPHPECILHCRAAQPRPCIYRLSAVGVEFSGETMTSYQGRASIQDQEEGIYR